MPTTPTIYFIWWRTDKNRQPFTTLHISEEGANAFKSDYPKNWKSRPDDEIHHLAVSKKEHASLVSKLAAGKGIRKLGHRGYIHDLKSK